MKKASILLALAVGYGCAASGAVHSALHDDLPTLRRHIGEERRRGALDRDRAMDIARAVAAREIASGAGPAGARRIRSLRGCSAELMGELDARARRFDEGGAEATLVLLASGRLRHANLFDRYRDADSPAWRAVAARQATAPEHFTLRRKYYVDPDERVRRAALEAANAAPTQLDFDALFEAARLDPDPMARSLAVRGLGALGGERASRALRDLWERAEEDVRLSILGAYATRRTFASGGREALLREAEMGRGVPAVAAAGELLRVDASYREHAVTLLVRALGEGDADERRLAILLAPLDHAAVAKALKKTAEDADPALRVTALEKLATLPGERARAVGELRTLGRGDSGAAHDAHRALARLGDASVLPKFRAELASKSLLRREAAGRALLALGDYASAAVLLGDGSADVRIATACTILATN